ncbi:hypothetical protein D4764_07G0008660 [Takifugu flavidus]|uniref:Uncharacterized protein n=1 Tax=Takifugu flavidus TaxID=433684 RepID=A0A5C6MXH8_9TELE|nr:hypothetical protein D4764_07G0008660 [Takifugu flavidus]
MDASAAVQRSTLGKQQLFTSLPKTPLLPPQRLGSARDVSSGAEKHFSRSLLPSSPPSFSQEASSGVIRPWSGNLAAATLTPPPSPTTSSSPQGQHSVPSRLNPPILSPDSSPSPPSIMPHCSPKLALGRGCGHQSQRVGLPVLMEDGVRVLSG